MYIRIDALERTRVVVGLGEKIEAKVRPTKIGSEKTMPERV